MFVTRSEYTRVDAAELNLELLEAIVKEAVDKEHDLNLFGKAVVPKGKMLGAIASLLPPTLWLYRTFQKEGYVFYSHAWGNSWVTSEQRPDGPKYPVSKLSMLVKMPSPIGDQTDIQSRDNSTDVSVEAKYGGSSPTNPDFDAHWEGTAYHPAYGTWGYSVDW